VGGKKRNKNRVRGIEGKNQKILVKKKKKKKKKEEKRKTLEKIKKKKKKKKSKGEVIKDASKRELASPRKLQRRSNRRKVDRYSINQAVPIINASANTTRN